MLSPADPLLAFVWFCGGEALSGLSCAVLPVPLFAGEVAYGYAAAAHFYAHCHSHCACVRAASRSLWRSCLSRSSRSSSSNSDAPVGLFYMSNNFFASPFDGVDDFHHAYPGGPGASKGFAPPFYAGASGFHPHAAGDVGFGAAALRKFSGSHPPAAGGGGGGGASPVGVLRAGPVSKSGFAGFAGGGGGAPPLDRASKSGLLIFFKNSYELPIPYLPRPA